MTRGEAIFRETLAAIGRLEPVTAVDLRAELEECLGLVGLMPRAKVDHVFVARDLIGVLTRMGFVEASIHPQDVDGYGRLLRGAAKFYELTPAGDVELDRLDRDSTASAIGIT
jgi:hypothetical protein